MLVFNRKLCEAVYITVPPSTETVTIRVEVTKFRGPDSGVQLGFTAPMHAIIDREEIYHAKLERDTAQHDRDTRLPTTASNPGNQTGHAGAIRTGDAAASHGKGKPFTR